MSTFDPILRKELNRELSWDELDSNFEQLTDVVANINTDLGNTNDRIDNVVIVVDETFNQVVEGLQTDLSNAVNNLEQQILQTQQDAEDALNQARDDLDLAVSNLEQGTIYGFLVVNDSIADLDDKIEQYQTDFDNEVILIRNNIDATVLQAKTEIEGQLEQVESLITDRVNQLESDVNNSVDNLQQTTLDGFNTVNNAITNLDDKIEQYQTDFENEIATLSGDVVNQIAQTKTDIENQLSVVDQRVDGVRDTLELARNNFKVEINKNMLDRKESDKLLFETTALAVQLRQNQADITNAIFEVDPATGTIRNLAYAYTDQQFTQAGLLIDGVNAEVQLQAQRVTSAEDRITNAESELLLQAGQIGLRATYTDVNHAIASAIDAVLPAYSFGFFNSNEGWVAVNGTLTPATSKINLTWGDIENTSLSYVADENPLISISIERTGGTGWSGNVIVTFDDNSTQTYTGVIEDIPTGSVFVRNLNLDGESTYTGNVTGIRLVFGDSVSDTFTVNSITIGKPSAALTELEGITAQINQVGIELNALEATLTNYVTVDQYTTEGVTRSNVETVLSGLDSYAAIQATLQEFDTEDTLTKANYAALWVDAANANIEQTVQSYNAREGGLDDQLETITGDLVVASSKIDAANGRISDQIVSISGIQSKSKDLEQVALQAEYQLYLSKKNQLEQGVAIAIAKNELNTLTNEQLALAEEILLLEAKFGTDIGQVNATVFNLSQALASETEARVQDISVLETNFGDISDAIRTDLTELISNETESRITQIEDLETSFNGEILATKTELTELVADETQARITSIDNIEARLDTTDGDISAAVTNLTQAIVDETQARTEAVQLLESDFNQTINANIDTVFLAVSDAEQSLSQQIVNLQANFGEEIGATSTQLLQAISNEQQARINQFNDLQAQFSGDIQATRTELTNLVADETQARIQDRLDLEVGFAGNYATKFEVTDAIATETQSRLDQIQQLEVDFGGDINAARQEAVSLVADESQARIQEISNLSATIGTTYATKTEVTDVVATETQARINSIEALTASIENNYATISQVDQIEADIESSKVTSQKSLIAVSGLEKKTNETALGQLSDAYKAYLTEKKVLDVGVSIASAENRLTALTDTQGAFAEELTVLDAKIGTVNGTVSANFTELNQTIVNETEARTQAILSLEANFGDAIEASATSLLETISDTEQSLSQQITNLQTEFNDDISANVGLLTQAISDEESARILQLQQLETQFGEDIVAAKDELTNVIADETQARISDISALETQFQTDLGVVNASLLTLDDAISSETQARVQAMQLLETNLGDDIEASANSILEVVSDTEQALSQQIVNLGNSFTEEISTNINILTQAISDEESARITQFNDLQTQFSDDIQAVETSLTTLISNETQARVTQFQEIETEFESNYATKFEVTDAISTEEQARINQIEALETSFGEDVNAVRQEAIDLVADENQARITAINTLSTEIGNTYASKTELTNVVATERDARIEAIETLAANVEDNYATISQVDQIEVDVESSNATSQKALVSISGVQKKADNTALEQLIEGYRLYLAEKGQLEIGVAVARAETGLETLTTANSALAQELTVLDAKIGTVAGTVSANFSDLNQAIVTEQDARVQSLESLSTSFSDEIGSVQDNLNVSFSNAFETFNQSIQHLDSKFQDIADATVLTVTQSIANESSARAEALTSLDAKFQGDLASSVDVFNKAISDERETRASSINNLRSELNTGISANATFILGTDAKANGNASAIAGLKTAVVGEGGDTSQAELILSSRLEEGRTAFSRAFLGVTNVVGGKATISGISIGGAETGLNGLSFQGDLFELTNTSGSRRLYWDTNSNTWVFNGRLVVGGYTVNSEADIRALDARTVDLVANISAIAYNTVGERLTDSVVFTATAKGLVGTAFYRFFVNNDPQGAGFTTSNKFTYTPPASYINTPISVRVEVREGTATGGLVAIDEVTVYPVKSGMDSYTVILSNESHSIPSEADGSVISMEGTGTEIRVYQGNVALVYNQSTSQSAYPTVNNTFNIQRTFSSGMRNAGSLSGAGTTTATQPDYGSLIAGDDLGWTDFTIRITNNEGVQIPPITKRQSFGKSKRGQSGQSGVYTEFRYRRLLSEPTSAPTVLVPSAWGLTIPASGDGDLYFITAVKDVVTGAFVDSGWSFPLRMQGQNGTSVNIKGELSNTGQLPSNAPDGDAYLIQGNLWVRTSGSWVNAGPIQGPQGATGQGVFKSIVFIRSNSDLSDSAPSGGSYSSPLPTTTGWSDGIPDGLETLWSSTRVFSSDGLVPQESSWSAPVKMTNTANLEIQYSSVELDQGTPSSEPDNWSTTPSESTIWLAKRIITNGVPEAWQVFKVKGEKGAEGNNAKTLVLWSNAQSFTFNGDNVLTPSNQSVVFSVNRQNITEDVVWTATNQAGNSVNLTSVTNNSATLSSANFGSNRSVLVTATAGTFTDSITIVRLVDGKNSVTGYLTNESHTVTTNTDGTGGVYTSAGGQLKVYDGTTLVSSGVVYSTRNVTSGLSISVNTSGTYTISGLTVDTATATIRAEYKNVTIDKVYTISKSKQGTAGANAINLVASLSSQSIVYRKDNTRSTNSIKVDTIGTNLPSGGVYEYELQAWRANDTYSPNKVLSDGSQTNERWTVNGSSATIDTSSAYTVFNPNNEFIFYRIRVRYLVSGNSVAEDFVSISKIYDGSEAITVVLSNEAHTLPANSLGTVTSMVGSGTTIKVYQGANLLTFRGTGSSGGAYPTQASSYQIQRTFSTNMRDAGIISGDGTTTATQPDYGNVAGNGTVTDWTEFAIRIRDVDGRELPVITKRQTLSKSKQGVDGAAGLNSATLTAYKRSASAPTDNAGNVTYTFATSAWTPANDWSKTIPATNGQPLWAISASAASNTATDNIAASEWSAPTKMLEDGADGLNVATVFLYRRTTGATPTLPTANITYTFATGEATGLTNSWTRDIPTTGGAYLWVTQATASSQGAIDVIAHTEWSAAAKLAADGLDGNNARVITLFATKQAIAYRKDGSRDTNSINFDTTMQSLSGGIYEFQLQCFRADGTYSPATATSDGSATHPNLTVSGGSVTLNTSSSNSVFNSNNEFVYYRMRVRYLVGGVPQAEDVVSISKVYDGSEAITVILSNEAHTLPANSLGTVSSMVGSGTTIKVYQGANLLTFRGTGSSGSNYPTQNSSFTINRTYSANMRDAGSMSGDGTTTATQPDYGNVAGNGSVTDWTEFAIRVKDADGRNIPVLVKRQTLSKSKQGTDGKDGKDGVDGVNGSIGAGFYSVNVNTNKPTINNTYLNSLFTPSSVAGRNPVNKDTFFVKWLNTQDAYEFNGTDWIAATLVVNGSIIASGSIAGDKFIAGTEISGPIIKGGELIAVGPNTEYFEVIRPEPFGPQNDLVNWYGPKVNGVTWNNTTGLPIYSGMTKANAKTYKTKDGSVYFGGTFIAGTISNAQSSTTKTSTPSTQITFTSNGGILELAGSFSFTGVYDGPRTQDNDNSWICPVDPVMSVVTGTLYIERQLSGGSWQIITQYPITGSYSCRNGEWDSEPGTPNIPYQAVSSSSAVVSTSIALGAGTVILRARAVLNNWFTLVENQNSSTGTSQAISITSKE